LISVHDGYHLWSERYDREMADVFDIQDEITSAIVKTIEPTLVGGTVPAVRRHTHNVKAFELYLQGRHFWTLRTPQSMPAALSCFERAIALDEDYALAYAGIAETYTIMTLYGFVSPAEARPKAEAAAARALVLEPDLAEAHMAMGVYKIWLSNAWPDAGRDLGQALAIRPDSSLIQSYYAFHLSVVGRYEEALMQSAKAATLDPLAPFARSAGSVVSYLAGRFEEAIALADQALELHRDFTMGL
jgi:tetratricopeptide (TPR) repeat protein